MEEDKEYEWRLIASRKDEPISRAAFEYAKNQFPLVKDSEAFVVDHDAYRELVDEKKMYPYGKFMGVPEGSIGLAYLSYYRKYSDTWNKVNTAITDFEAGWRACEKQPKK